MSRQFLACWTSAQPDGRGPAQLHPRWAYSGRILPPQCGARSVINHTRKCGFRSDDTYRRLFRLVGDLYDTSGCPVCS